MDRESRQAGTRARLTGKVAGALICLGLLAAVLPASASATQVVWGPTLFPNDSKSIGVAWPQGTTVKGRMTTIDDNGAAGDQVGGGPLCQVGLVRNGPTEQDYVVWRQQCVTVPAGARTFNYEFPVPGGAEGPSQKLVYLYFDNGDGQLDGSPDQLGFNVAFRPQLYPQERKVRNGEKVKFVGAIPAFFFGTSPQMALQVRQGKKWRTFKVLSVQNDGSYVGVYRFTNTRQKTEYKFRVKPIPNGIYPVVLSASPKAKVVVKP